MSCGNNMVLIAFSKGLNLSILFDFDSLKLISNINFNKDNFISGKLCTKVFAIIVSNLLSTKTLIKLSFHLLSFVFFWKAFINIFTINSVKHGDKSKVNSLNKSKAFSGSCEFIITFIIFSIHCNFLSIGGFIIILLPLYSSFIIDKCLWQHISVYLFLS